MPDLHSPLCPPLNSTPGFRQSWANLQGASQALAIHAAAQNHSSVTLVVTPDTQSARQLERELRFFAADSELEILHLPDWEILPYDTFSPHQDIVSERLRALHSLPTLGKGVLVVPVSTLMHRVAPLQYLQSNSLVVQIGQKLNLNAMRSTLEEAGYSCVDTVYEHGEFAVRGSLIDIFPMGCQEPFRVDLFDDQVDTLRTFDPESQRSLNQVESIEVLPGKEYPLDDAGIAHFRNAWHSRFDVDHKSCPIYQDISSGLSPAGIEYYLPLFFSSCSTLFDYLPGDTQVFFLRDILPASENFSHEVNERYQSRCGDLQRPILRPVEVFLTVSELFQCFKAYPRVTLVPQTTAQGGDELQFNCCPRAEIRINPGTEEPLLNLENYLADTDHRVLFCVESAGRRENLLELLRRIDVRPDNIGWSDFISSDATLAITVAPLDTGFSLQQPAISLITETELYGERVQQRRRRRVTRQDQADMGVRSLAELRPGSPVVHIDHGVGRYRGLKTLSVDGQSNEFLMLEYANQANLYVPVASLDLISRYSGADEEHAPLHRLGSEQWQKAKRKAAEQVRDSAAELLDIYARRAARRGHAFSDPKADYERFASAFPFEETADQQQAIDAVYQDMLAPQPMDRLICGDVGFGKTEVAMRAAFIAVHSGRQVAMLVPTTLLAQQHFDNFRDRFADWSIQIEVVSRFRSAAELQKVEQRLAEGKVDIIIGTHKLLQSGLNYKNLGLLIIDEEHRFGVRQKEAIKSLRSEVDILTLTATPIPRTLNMAMSGIRDLSIIATPPARRLSVKTFVRVSHQALVKEAILRELLRGGQVFYLHNEVKSIARTAQAITDLAPEARVVVAHGQMREKQLEQVMSDFYHKRFNVLVCTTIIETGIDIPSANTIIIDRADKFGLAQLHQLRGRVGRSHHQAYAYLLTPDRKSMTPDAIKRLDAIATTTDLGAGFTLATHDLEIRGAGELLGEDQSGQMQAVGFTLYMEMLDRAVQSIKRGGGPDPAGEEQSGTDIDLRIPALIPEDYIGDVHSRLILYKRIASAADEEALRDLQVEMIDRFGLLPEPCKNLFSVAGLKLSARQMGLKKIEAGPRGGQIEFAGVTEVDPLTIVKLVQTQPQIYQLVGGNVLKFKSDMDNRSERLQRVSELLSRLQKP